MVPLQQLLEQDETSYGLEGETAFCPVEIFYILTFWIQFHGLIGWTSIEEILRRFKEETIKQYGMDAKRRFSIVMYLPLKNFLLFKTLNYFWFLFHLNSEILPLSIFPLTPITYGEKY